MQPESERALQREVFLAFWKVHILHHPSEEGVVGLWMLDELRRHGYEVSPGTLYPMLHRMERLGWLEGSSEKPWHSKARRCHRITAEGRRVLERIRGQLRELSGETGVSDKGTTGEGNP